MAEDFEERSRRVVEFYKNNLNRVEPMRLTEWWASTDCTMIRITLEEGLSLGFPDTGRGTLQIDTGEHDYNNRKVVLGYCKWCCLPKSVTDIFGNELSIPYGYILYFMHKETK